MTALVNHQNDVNVGCFISIDEAVRKSIEEATTIRWFKNLKHGRPVLDLLNRFFHFSQKRITKTLSFQLVVKRGIQNIGFGPGIKNGGLH